MSKTLCPICGREISPSPIYTGDPIFTTPTLSTVQYEGFTILLAKHIEELQIERAQQEIDNGITPLTVFSPVDTTNLYQNIKQYILELRSSTEKILTAVGTTLEDFLSKDEDGNLISVKTNWTDPNLEETKYQCNAIHIEDLRHFISTFWIEKWEGFPDYTYLNETHTEAGLDWTYDFPMGAVIGNKGDWNSLASASRHIGTLGIENDTILANCYMASEKLTMHLNTQGTMITPGIAGINTGLISNMQIHNDLSYLLKSNTRFSFDLTNFINSTSGLVNYSRTRVSLKVGGNTLYYDLTIAGLNINVYDEYVILYGIPPVGTTITQISFVLSGRIFPLTNPGDTGQFELKCTLDNIKLMNV